MRNPQILCTIEIFLVFLRSNFFSRFLEGINLKFILCPWMITRWNIAQYNFKILKILENFWGYEECEESSCSLYPCDFFSIFEK